MSKRVFFAQLPPNPKAIPLGLEARSLEDLSVVLLVDETGKLGVGQQVKLRELQPTDRLILLLAPQDVSVIRLKLPPLSPADIRLAMPALLKEALDADPGNVASVISQRSVEKNGVRHGFVALCDVQWIDSIKKHVASLPCRQVNLYPVFEVIPPSVDKCTFLVDLDEVGAIAWRCGEAVGGGATLFDDADSDQFEAYSTALARGHGCRPEDSVVLSCKSQRATSGREESHVELQSLIKDAISDKKAAAWFDFLEIRRASGSIANLQQYLPSRFALFLVAFLLVEISIGLYQRYQLQSQGEQLKSEQMAIISGKSHADVVLSGDEDVVLQRALKNIRFAKGFDGNGDFTALTRVLAGSISGDAFSSIVSLSYKNSTLFVTTEDDHVLTLDSEKFPSFSLTKIKAGQWKISGHNL